MKNYLIYYIPIISYTFILTKTHSKVYDCQRLNSSIGQIDSSLFNISTLLFTDFDTFNELKIDCSEVFEVYFIQIIPNKNILLDRSLNLTSLKVINYVNEPVYYYFSNLNGFDLETNSKFIESAYIEYSNFNFYYQKSLIDQEDKCENFSILNPNPSLFMNLKLILFKNFNKYSKKTCPLAFNNTNLEYFGVQFISNSFLNKNQFEFLNMSKKIENKKFYSKIKNSSIMVFYDVLTEKILNRNVFQNIERIRIEGYIYYFQPDLFKNSKKLIKLNIKLLNQRYFFHNGNEWFNYIRYKSFEFDRKNLLYITFNTNTLQVFQSIYDYPDEDFCLFHRFPHKKYVYPKIDPGMKINCSCTILWLMNNTLRYFLPTKTTNYVSNFIDENFFFTENIKHIISLSYCLFLTNFESLIRSCHFDERIKNCDKQTYSLKKSSIWENYDITDDQSFTQSFKLIELIILIILNPICAIFGILFNILIIAVIVNLKNLNKRRQAKNKINQSMFKHIQINSIFNVFYCFIMLFKLINECLFYTSTIYCPSISILKSSQSFKIIIVEFLGNIIKICSNVSYIGIVLSRFNLIKTKKERNLSKFDKFKLKIYLILLILVSSLLSIFKLFEYKIDIHEFSYGNFDFPIERRGLVFCLRNPIECKVFISIKLANNIINDFVFYIITLIVDIILLKNMEDNFRKKKKLVKTFKEDDERDSKSRINKLVFINGMIYLIGHLPEFLTIIVLAIFQKKMEPFCMNNMTCDKFNEVAQFFNYLSIISQFFINIKFNKVFKESFLLLKTKKYLKN